MIISFEGVVATGKTTVSEYLAAKYGAIRIAEVNEMFAPRPIPEPAMWYFDREIERWELACEQDGTDRLIILDGDPYMPVWFNWIYPELPFQPWWEVLEFFETRLDQVGIPGYYVYLHTTASERYRREHKRETARGHDEEQFIAKFERYATMLGPQMAYFNALGQRFPGLVYSQEAAELEATALCSLDRHPTAVDTAQVFSFMRSWLGSHNPDDF